MLTIKIMIIYALHSFAYMFIDLYIKLDKSKYLLEDDQIYVLLATIADVMPLRGINKILAVNVIK